MDQPLHPLSVAEEAPGAAIVYLPLFPHGFRTAIGACEVKGPYLTRLRAREVITDLRNDMDCPLHDTAVALPQDQPSDLVHFECGREAVRERGGEVGQKSGGAGAI